MAVILYWNSGIEYSFNFLLLRLKYSILNCHETCFCLTCIVSYIRVIESWTQGCRVGLPELEETLLRSKRLSRTETEDIYPLLSDTCNREKQWRVNILGSLTLGIKAILLWSHTVATLAMLTLYFKINLHLLQVWKIFPKLKVKRIILQLQWYWLTN